MTQVSNMGGKIKLEVKAKTSRTSKTKSKSGCRTCKIRRVKCDEYRPACYRCVSTGRTCDGYGIWGGGGRAAGCQSIGSQKSKDCHAIPPHTEPSLSLAGTKDETSYFEWFKFRTATKLPGLFASSFWDTMLLQATSNEPAVWHAVLALSSAHKRECLNGQSKMGKGPPLDGHEKFMLRQYSKAIGYLTQSRSSAKVKTDIRIALITCVVFICLELLLGRYKIAQSHLENGLNLLDELELSGSVLLPHSRDSTDDSIMEEFSRIYSQVQLFVQPFQKPRICLPISDVGIPTPMFQSIEQAGQHLHQLFSHIFYLTEQVREQRVSLKAELSLELINHQTNILAKLTSWLHTYKASRATFLVQMPDRGAFAYEMLHLYRIMATIMAHACLSPTDEWIYDAHANDFVTMLMKAIHIRQIFPKISDILHGHNIGKSKATMGMGWIPTLYFVAIKCRIHRVRLQAIKLLQSTGPLHREGIWDADIAACVAKKVMDIEERDFYQDLHTNEDFGFCTPPREEDFLIQVLPDEYRLHDVHVLLPDDSQGKIVLSCMRKQDDGGSVMLINEYDMLSQLWSDGGEVRE
ncbi:hypothetical protein N431DRAFT_370905 [Stipitochalara longipes BDJ]|nr:hypothetical protein N431DRAFT_370905 [Stipitochalara longipes BDJ]